MPLQVTDADLMELIRTNVKLTIPYAGAFLKKDDRYTVHTFLYMTLCICTCVDAGMSFTNICIPTVNTVLH